MSQQPDQPNVTYMENQRPSFVTQYQNASEMLNKMRSKRQASATNTASSLVQNTGAVRPRTGVKVKLPNKLTVDESGIKSHENLGMAKTAQEFFKTNNQHAFDSLQIGAKFRRNSEDEFSLTRFKKRAVTNYEKMPLSSRHNSID